MYGKMKDHLSKTLAEIKEAGLYKEERLIELSLIHISEPTRPY